MALNFEAKKAVVEQVNAVATGAVSVGAAEYRGLNVEQMTNLRSAAIEADVSLRVVKNTLAKRALAETGCECILPVLSGPVILGFSQEDPGAVARVFRDFIKENKEIEFPMLILMGFLATLLLVGSTNLISVFISLECLAFLSYVLVAFERSNKLSVQAGVRYLFLGAVPTGLFVLGIVETYSFLGTFNLDDIYALTFGTEEIIDEHNSGGNSHTSKIFDADVTFAAIAIQKFHEAHSAAWYVGGCNLNLGLDDNIIFGVENIGDAYLKTELDDALGAFESYMPIKTPGHISEELISYAKLFYFDEEEVVMKRIQIKPQGFGIELLYDVLLAEQFQFEQQIAAQQLGSEAVRFMKESVVIANE